MTPSKHHCPIPGCHHVYEKGVLGWSRHIGYALAQHPNWHPNVLDVRERMRLFEAEYPRFFDGTKYVPSTPPPQPSVAPPSSPSSAASGTGGGAGASSLSVTLGPLVRAMVRREVAAALEEMFGEGGEVGR